MKIRKRLLNLFVHRFEGDDTVMTPMVIRAFYTIFSGMGDKVESSGRTTLKSSMMEILYKNEFPPELSAKIVDFILDNLE